MSGFPVHVIGTKNRERDNGCSVTPAAIGGNSRRKPGLYLRVPRGFQGVRVDHFLVDPPSRWVEQRPGLFVVDHEGANHVFATVSIARYPYVPDLVEEARVHGISIPHQARVDLQRLTPEVSELVVAHPRAVALPSFDGPADGYECPYGRCGYLAAGDDVPCSFHRALAKTHEAEAKDASLPVDLGALWSLSTLRSVKRTHEVRPLGNGRFRVVTPRVSYEVVRPEDWRRRDVQYRAGLVFRFPSFFLEVVDPSGAIPLAVQRRADRAGWELWLATE